MIDTVAAYWYIFLGLIFVSILLTLLLQKKVKYLLKSFYNKAPLIKKYWLFVIPFIAFCVIAYPIVTILSTKQDLSNNLSILNQATTLIFAIFAGYFAFQQVVENRLEKLKEQGHLYFKQDSYLRAIQYYEEAYSINPKDFSLLSDLLEIYLAIQDYKKFDAKINQLEKLRIEDYEWSTLVYLKTARYLFEQNLGIAKTEIQTYINLVKEKPQCLTIFRWDFSDIKGSDVYKRLDGESKIIFDNFISYLNKELDDTKKKQFEEGNLTLK